MGFFKTRRPILAAGTEISVLDAASQVEAEAGSETGPRSFSPLRIAQAIAALGAGVFSGARVVVDTNVVATSTNQVLDFTATEDFDDGAWYDNGVSTTNVVVPTGVTRVMCVGEVTWAGSSVGERRLRIDVNGISVGEVRIASTAAGAIRQQAVAIIDVVATDVITLKAFHTVGSNLNVTQGFFAVTKLG